LKIFIIPFQDPETNTSILFKQLIIRGFFCDQWLDEWPEAHSTMNKYIQDGDLKVKETVYNGIENMRRAFINIFKGDNYGKTVIKAINEQTNYP
jgi:prostaglandin reductase 1